MQNIVEEFDLIQAITNPYFLNFKVSVSICTPPAQLMPLLYGL